MNSRTRDSILSKAFVGFRLIALKNWGQRFISTIVFLVLARLLAPEIVGLVALVLAYLALLDIFIDHGMVEAIVQRETVSSSMANTAFCAAVGISLMAVVITITAAPFLSWVFNEPELPSIAWSLSVLSAVRGFTVTKQSMLQREMSFEPIAYGGIIGVFCGALVGLGLASIGAGIWALVLYHMVSRIVEGAVIWRKSKWYPKLEFRMSEWRVLFCYGRTVMASRFVNFFNRYGAELIIGAFLGVAAVGVFTVAFRLIRIVVEMIGAVASRVCLPLFSRINENPEVARAIYLQLIAQVAFVSFPTFASIAMCAPMIVNMLFGVEWVGAIQMMQVLAFIGALHSVYYLNTSVMLAFGEVKARLKLDILNSVSNLLVMSLMAQISAFAVAVGYTVRAYVFAPLPYLVIRRVLTLSRSCFIDSLMPALLGTVLMVLVFVFTRQLIGGSESQFFPTMVPLVASLITYSAYIFLKCPEIPRKFVQVFVPAK